MCITLVLLCILYSYTSCNYTCLRVAFTGKLNAIAKCQTRDKSSKFKVLVLTVPLNFEILSLLGSRGWCQVSTTSSSMDGTSVSGVGQGDDSECISEVFQDLTTTTTAHSQCDRKQTR